MSITEPAPAKINLALHIRRKRPDGYHDLETLFAFARDGDVMTVEVAERDGFVITGAFAKALSPPRSAKADGLRPARSGRTIIDRTGDGDQNLVIRARDRFRATFAITQPHAIVLEKNLPIASGIGGGSADAAATLRALAKLHDIDPAEPRLVAIARSLGADVPACLFGETAFATGRGDELEPLPPLGDIPLLLVNPGVSLATAAMFAIWDGVDRGGIVTRGSTLDRARAGRNDFTAAAIEQAPAVAAVLDLLAAAPGANFTRLSGSGATCFALFDTRPELARAAEAARSRGWWTLATVAV